MNDAFEQILDSFNTGFGFTGSIITIYDHFKNRNNTHIKETLKAMRSQSKKAYDLYCEYREYRKDDIGVPLEEDILNYWESCLRRDTLPSVDDMVSSKTACQEEAEILLAYLLKSWMEVPDFAEWLHGILTQDKLETLAETFAEFQKNTTDGLLKLTNELKQQNISGIAFPISPGRIVNAKNSCTDLDVKHYYMVDNSFGTMFKVICAEHDIPHREACQKAIDLARERLPVIITGNSGFGKTNLMMHTALQWASQGRITVWLSLSAEDVITKQKAENFFRSLTESIPAGQRALLCIDNPYESRTSFSNLREMWPGGDNIQLIMAERANRLTLLADPNQDSLLYWFDDAQVILLQGIKQSKPKFELEKNYTYHTFPETTTRRKKILDKCTLFLAQEGIVADKDRLGILETILSKYGQPTVSLIELIYRTLFEIKKKASKPGAIKLDWEEWETFIESGFGKGQSYTQTELYGVIAALKIFNTPITVSLFCKYFELNERKFKNHLERAFIPLYSEPVIFRGGRLHPKHDVIAELFFLFHKKSISINSLMTDLLKCMDENEVETLLANMVSKKNFRKGRKSHIWQIRYRDYMDVIYRRMTIEHNCNLSETGRTFLCLGYLWSRFQQSSPESYTSLNSILTEIAPEIDDTLITAKLYTEWGIWTRISGNAAHAEELLRKVAEKHPKDIVSRTELGKLLLEQKSRKKEAEEVLREVIKIDAKNIMARTELGRLLVRQKGRKKEAENILREALKIDPENLHPHTELGKLLAGQKGREKEAEDILREAMRIDARHVHSRTELGRLLSRQKGREKEAEDIFREAIQIEPNGIHARTELGKLLSRQKGREKEAEKILRKVMQIEPKHIPSRIVLARLYKNSGRLAEAAVLYQELCKYDPENPDSRKEFERLKNYIKK